MPIAAIILGVYVLVVVSQGNSTALIGEVNASVGFVKWLIAAGILFWLAGTNTFGPAVTPFVTIAAIAFALTSLPQLQSQFSEVWDRLGK